MSLKELESRIRKFLSGHNSPQGRKLFDQWYDSFDNQNASLSHDQKHQIKKRMYQNIQSQMEASKTRNKGSQALRRRLITATKVAASIALIVSVLWGVQRWSAQEMLIHQTAFGETKQLQLPDGTIVNLNANSSLRYAGNNPREVWLEGEGFFEVRKKPRTKAVFLVHTQDLVIEVLGTAFNVNSRHEKTEVVLEEGSIKLNLEDGKEEMMEPGDLIAYSGKEARILERDTAVSTEVHSSWKNGTILLDLTTLDEATQKVADHYGVAFKFGTNSLKEKVMNGGVPMDNLGVSLQMLEITFSIQIDQKGSYYLITQDEGPQ